MNIINFLEGFVDPELKKQSEELTWDLIEVRDQLFKKREEGFSIALLLQKKAIARDINELVSYFYSLKIKIP